MGHDSWENRIYQILDDIHSDSTNAMRVQMGDTFSIDAFGRQRTSNPQTIFDSKQIFDNQPLFWDDQEVSGSGTGSSYSANKASTTISVGASTAGRRVRQTFRRFNYQPGKSQLVFMTGTLGASGGGAGITRCAGLYDDNNGIFFRDNEGTIEVVRRSYTTGSAVDTSVAQSNWNLDPLDGTGPSGYTLDGTKSQILVYDMEWLGVGRLRAGFVINGAIIYVHQFTHSNEAVGVYMTTPNLPLRYEIENDGTGAASELETICSTVISEGGQQRTGVIRSASTEGTHVDANSADTIYAVLGIRLKSGYLGCTVDLVSKTMISETNDDFEWMIFFNPTVAGTFTYSDETNSCLQAARGATANTVTGGVPLDCGYSKSSNSSSAGFDNALRLGSAIDGTPDEIVLCCRPLSANADIQGSLTWRELL